MNDSDRTNRETTQIWSMNRIEAPFLVRLLDYLPCQVGTRGLFKFLSRGRHKSANGSHIMRQISFFLQISRPCS